MHRWTYWCLKKTPRFWISTSIHCPLNKPLERNSKYLPFCLSNSSKIGSSRWLKAANSKILNVSESSPKSAITNWHKNKIFNSMSTTCSPHHMKTGMLCLSKRFARKRGPQGGYLIIVLMRKEERRREINRVTSRKSLKILSSITTTCKYWRRVSSSLRRTCLQKWLKPIWLSLGRWNSPFWSARTRKIWIFCNWLEWSGVLINSDDRVKKGNQLIINITW